MDDALYSELMTGLQNGSIVPCLGPGVLADVLSPDGARMPATSDELILGLNGGKPMAPKLMYEFSRAAMNIEHKRGRAAVNNYLTRTYGETRWSRAALHDWLKTIRPAYVIDLNRDTQLIDSHAGTPHYLVVGCARLSGVSYRFNLYRHDGARYEEIRPEAATAPLPVLFKPMGSPVPQPSYIASDADYVDYITELMGGFGVPAFVKAMRRGKRYLFIGMRLNRDTERMVMADLIYDAAERAGWALISNPTAKERNFLAKHRIALIEDDFAALLDKSALALA